MCGKAAISEEALGCHMLALPDLELKKCNNCDKLFNTDKNKQTYIEKYHITIPEKLNEPELEKLPEITQRRKQNFPEIQVENSEFKNTGGVAKFR